MSIYTYWPSRVPTYWESNIANSDSTPTRVHKAMLQTTFDYDDDPQVVRHVIQDATDTPGLWRKEQWTKQKLLGRGGFGSVFLEKCTEVTGYMGAGEDKTGELRAVKRLQKPRNEVSLSAELCREINTLLFFSRIEVLTRSPVLTIFPRVLSGPRKPSFPSGHPEKLHLLTLPRVVRIPLRQDLRLLRV